MGFLRYTSGEYFQCSKLNQKSCQSCCLESQIINIKLKKSLKKVTGPPPKLSASGWGTGSNLEHWYFIVVSETTCRIDIRLRQKVWHFADAIIKCIHWMKIIVFWAKFHSSLFPQAQLKITQHFWNFITNMNVTIWCNPSVTSSNSIKGSTVSPTPSPPLPPKRRQGKSEGFDSCDRPSNLTQIGLKSSIFQHVWPWNLMDDPKKQ